MAHNRNAPKRGSAWQNLTKSHGLEQRRLREEQRRLREEQRRSRAEQRRWRAEMKRLGVEIVRTRFAARMPITDNVPYPDTDFVQRWLAKQNRKAKLQIDILTTVAVLGAIAACVAAWPVVKEWLQ